MKHMLITTIAAVLLTGCRPNEPVIPFNEASEDGNIEDLTVIMRVNPTSPDVAGHTRTEFDVGDI
ncbi:MAG: hypothetical protein QF731_10985, partial [Verrucomicrobiota bacterium]|nr:hypothetical protein [Verrucomicrobiota bacterium]